MRRTRAISWQASKQRPRMMALCSARERRREARAASKRHRRSGRRRMTSPNLQITMIPSLNLEMIAKLEDKRWKLKTRGAKFVQTNRNKARRSNLLKTTRQ